MSLPQLLRIFKLQRRTQPKPGIENSKTPLLSDENQGSDKKRLCSIICGQDNVSSFAYPMRQAEGSSSSINVSPIPHELIQVCEDDFAVLQFVDCGGQGYVGAAICSSSGKLVAIKAFTKKREERPNERQMLERLQMAGPKARILDIFEYKFDTGLTREARFVTEYCNGGDLDYFKQLCESKRIDVPESFIWHVFGQMLEAVAFLHLGYGRRRGKEITWKPIVHKDIKSENVLLQRDPKRPEWYPICKLADFDFAKVYDKRDPSTQYGCTGTPRFQPPEQWADPENPRATPSGDMYAVGAVLHCLSNRCGCTPAEDFEECLKEQKDDDAASETKKNLQRDRNYKHTPRRRIRIAERPDTRFDVKRTYSHKLQWYMGLLLNEDPYTRWTAEELVEIVPNLRRKARKHAKSDARFYEPSSSFPEHLFDYRDIQVNGV